MFRLFGQYVPVKSLILAITESALIIVSFWLAAWGRLGGVDALTSQLDEGYYLAWKLGAVVVICVICFYFNDLYDLHVVARRAELLTRLAQSLGMASLILALLYYLIPQLMFGRGVSAWAALTTGIVLVGWRLVVDATGKFFRPEQRILVAG